jgi:hypothetical protein
MFSPYLFDAGFDGASDGSEVIETSTSSIDLETLEEHISAFDQIVEQFFVLLKQLQIAYTYLAS